MTLCVRDAAGNICITVRYMPGRRREVELPMADDPNSPQPPAEADDASFRFADAERDRELEAGIDSAKPHPARMWTFLDRR
jgi:hypothetical protein